MKVTRVIILLIIIMLSVTPIVLGDKSDRTYEREQNYRVGKIKVYVVNDNDEKVMIEDVSDDSVEGFPVVFIKETSTMPDIRVEFPGFNFPKVFDIEAKFRLKVEYKINPEADSGKTRNDVDYFPYYLKPETWHTIEVQEGDEEEIWDIDFNDYFCGGTAILKYKVKGDTKHAPNLKIAEGKFIFYIRGRNPENSTIEDYISNNSTNNRWYYMPIMKHESGGGYQFNQKDGDRYGPGEKNYERAPLWGTPDGWGLMQLEEGARNNYLDDIEAGEDGRRPQQLLWNWKDNVDAGIEWLELKRDSAINWLKRQLSHAVYYSGGRNNVPSLPTPTTNDVTFNEFSWSCDPSYTDEELDMRAELINRRQEIENNDEEYPTQQEKEAAKQEAEYDIVDEYVSPYITITSNDEEKTLLDGCTIKRYNGGNFLAYVRGNSSNGSWTTPETEGYVSYVCQDYEGDESEEGN
jgi:hypothetical protein